jgi:hypothetical protein
VEVAKLGLDHCYLFFVVVEGFLFWGFFGLFVCLFSVLGFELRSYPISHSTSPFLCWLFSR